MLIVEEVFRRSVRREARDVELCNRRLGRREHVLAYPGARVPQLTDELCANQDCNHRIFRTLEELDSGIPSVYEGMRYCSEACKMMDTRNRREGLCGSCVLWYADRSVRLACSHLLCKDCMHSYPLGCPLCASAMSATVNYNTNHVHTNTNHTHAPSPLKSPIPVRVATRLNHYINRPIPEYRPSNVSPQPHISPTPPTQPPTPTRPALQEPPLRNTW